MLSSLYSSVCNCFRSIKKYVRNRGRSISKVWSLKTAPDIDFSDKNAMESSEKKMHSVREKTIEYEEK